MARHAARTFYPGRVSFLVVNLKTAKATDLIIPETFLVRAEEIIE